MIARFCSRQGVAGGGAVILRPQDRVLRVSPSAGSFGCALLGSNSFGIVVRYGYTADEHWSCVRLNTTLRAATC